MTTDRSDDFVYFHRMWCAMREEVRDTHGYELSLESTFTKTLQLVDDAIRLTSAPEQLEIWTRIKPDLRHFMGALGDTTPFIQPNLCTDSSLPPATRDTFQPYSAMEVFALLFDEMRQCDDRRTNATATVHDTGVDSKGVDELPKPSAQKAASRILTEIKRQMTAEAKAVTCG